MRARHEVDDLSRVTGGPQKAVRCRFRPRFVADLNDPAFAGAVAHRVLDGVTARVFLLNSYFREVGLPFVAAQADEQVARGHVRRLMPQHSFARDHFVLILFLVLLLVLLRQAERHAQRQRRDDREREKFCG